jgi:hypothetical protein
MVRSALLVWPVSLRSSSFCGSSICMSLNEPTNHHLNLSILTCKYDCTGTAFEQKILAQPKNVKFNFLHTTDPYHKYYKFKITEIKEGPDAAKAAFATTSTPGSEASAAVPEKPVEQEVVPPPTQELRKPDDEKYTAHVPAGLTPQVCNGLPIPSTTCSWESRTQSPDIDT